MSLIPTESTVRLESKPGRHSSVTRDLLTGAGSYATTLLVWAIDHFGFDEESKQPNVFLWSPETVQQEIEHAAGGKVPKRNFDKLMAAITVVTTDLFFQDVSRFIELANILAGDDFQPDEFEPADAVECAWAVTEALLLVPPDHQNPEPFNEEIRHYIGHVLREEGYVTAPDVLGIALDADFSAQVSYNFADDPELFGAIHKNQTAKTQEVAVVIGDGLRELFEQLKALHLREGNTQDLEKRLGQVLRQTDAQAQEGG